MQITAIYNLQATRKVSAPPLFLWLTSNTIISTKKVFASFPFKKKKPNQTKTKIYGYFVPFIKQVFQNHPPCLLTLPKYMLIFFIHIKTLKFNSCYGKRFLFSKPFKIWPFMSLRVLGVGPKQYLHEWGKSNGNRNIPVFSFFFFFFYLDKYNCPSKSHSKTIFRSISDFHLWSIS